MPRCRKMQDKNDLASSSALVAHGTARDIHAAIQKWQARAPQSVDSEAKSLIARFCESILRLLKQVSRQISTRNDIPKEVRTSLELSRSTMVLWSDGYRIQDGSLDEMFERSRSLRKSTMSNLSSIADLLLNRLLPLVATSADLDELALQLKAIHEEASYLTHDTNDHDGDDSDSSSQGSFDSTLDSYVDIAEDMKTDVECLMELGPLFENPAFDPTSGRDNVAAIEWTPRMIFCEKVAQRFPTADVSIVEKMGETNWARYLRCQEMRTGRQSDQQDDPQAVEEAPAGTMAGSKFHDSGLGTSIPASSSYAETVMTYGGVGEQKTRIPPLSEDAKTGKPFPCVACGRHLRITDNSAWKRHLFLDLEPYICLEPACATAAFGKRSDWMAHLALEHKFEPMWKSTTCQLCSQDTGNGKLAITRHLAGHLEEMSLSALPYHEDDEAPENEGEEVPESEDDGASETNSSNPPKKYCLCQNVGFGDMIACDNDDCSYEWFHWSCVGIKSEPSGRWYCPPCTDGLGRVVKDEAPTTLLPTQARTPGLPGSAGGQAEYQDTGRDRDHNRDHRVEREPEWMDEPEDDRSNGKREPEWMDESEDDRSNGKTEEDFKKFMERMKAGNGAASTKEEKAEASEKPGVAKQYIVTAIESATAK